MLLYTDPCFLDHETGQHPECAERLRAINRHLKSHSLFDRCELRDCPSISLERLVRVHAPEHAAQVAEFAAGGGGRIESDTIVSTESYDVALRAAGAVSDAVERVVRGESDKALCLVRPPGHHAVQRSAMGFCLFNNIAIGARTATHELDVDRVLIVDWDVHHGNGTQATFWEDEQVGFMSIHRWPFYPGSGAGDETGSDAGLGATLNIPIEFGTSRRTYFDTFTAKLETFAKRIRPQLVLISAGFDSHRLDPIGSLGLETEDFSDLTDIVLRVAEEYAQGRVVSVLEGGYNTEILPHCVELHLQHLLNATVPRSAGSIGATTWSLET